MDILFIYAMYLDGENGFRLIALAMMLCVSEALWSAHDRFVMKKNNHPPELRRVIFRVIFRVMNAQGHGLAVMRKALRERGWSPDGRLHPPESCGWFNCRGRPGRTA